MVSYYAPNGHYAGDTNYFAAQGVDNAPLHALRDGVDGVNGVYRYGAGFPTLSWLSRPTTTSTWSSARAAARPTPRRRP